MESTEKRIDSGRRSTRVRAQIPLRVTSLDTTSPFSESGHTLVVNTQGCGVRLSRPLQAGTDVFLDELPTGKRAPPAWPTVCRWDQVASAGWSVLRSTLPVTFGGFILHPRIGEQRRQLRARRSRLLPRTANGPIVSSLTGANFIRAEGNRYLTGALSVFVMTLPGRHQGRK